MVALADAGASDVELAADWNVAGSSFVSGQLVFRASDVRHYLVAAYTTDENAGSVVMQILKVTPETGAVPLATVGAARPGLPSTHRLEVHSAGSRVEFYVDGMLRVNVNTTFNVTATGVGLRWAIDASTTADNFPSPARTRRSCLGICQRELFRCHDRTDRSGSDSAGPCGVGFQWSCRIYRP